MKSLKVLGLTLGVSLTAALTASAQLNATEGFDYATGAGIATMGVPGSGASGWQTMATTVNAAGGYWNSKSDPNPATEISGTSLGYTDGSGNVLNTSGGSLISQTTTSTTSQPEIMLGSGATFGSLGAGNTVQANTLWVSYLWKGLNTSANGSTFRQATMMFVTGMTSTGLGSGSERLDVGMPNIYASNMGTVNPLVSLWTAGGISGGNGTLSSLAPLQSSVAANNGQTAFILMEFSLDNTATTADSVSVWINPTLGVYTPAGLGTPSLTWGSQDMSAINGLRLSGQSFNASANAGGQEQADEINIGYTAQDVESFTAGSVPEPATVTLATLGALGLFGLIRKRS